MTTTNNSPTPIADAPRASTGTNIETDGRVSSRVSVIDVTSLDAVIDLRATSPADRYREAHDDSALLLRELRAELPNVAFEEGNGVVGVFAHGESRYGDIVRAVEIDQGWGDMPTYMDGYEHASVFFLWFDNSAGGQRDLVHCGRLLRGDLLASTSCGSQVVDTALAHLDAPVTVDEVLTFHQIADIRSCWDIVSSISLNSRGVTRTPYGLLSFRMGLDLLAAHDVPKAFSWINPLTQRSFRRLAMPATQLCGRTIPAPQIDGYEYNEGFFAGCQDVIESRAGLMNTRHKAGSYVATARDWPLSFVSLDDSIMNTTLAARLDA
jgi:hypothetical protein